MRSVTIIVIHSPHVLKTMTEKPSYYLPQNGHGHVLWMSTQDNDPLFLFLNFYTVL